jgi:hypothetical protein
MNWMRPIDLELEAERRRALKQRYPELVAELTRIFAEDDPMGLMDDDGMNAIEYDGEIGTILPRLGDCESSEDVQAVIAEEFSRWFNGGGKFPQHFRATAERVWEAWNARKQP